MITFTQKGDFKKTTGFIEKVKGLAKVSNLDRFGQEGVQALKEATPKDTGKTASSWDYRIERTKDRVIIEWTNSNIQNGVNVAILLQYGHGTGWGGYVKGIDYINPTMKPVFDKILENVWKEVERL